MLNNLCLAVLLAGPLLHNGTYHLFWQNVPNSSEWSWGLGWVSSTCTACKPLAGNPIMRRQKHCADAQVQPRMSTSRHRVSKTSARLTDRHHIKTVTCTKHHAACQLVS